MERVLLRQPGLTVPNRGIYIWAHMHCYDWSLKCTGAGADSPRFEVQKPRQNSRDPQAISCKQPDHEVKIKRRGSMRMHRSCTARCSGRQCLLPPLSLAYIS